jgi:aspartate aminotransferase
MHASAYALDRGDAFIEEFKGAYVKRRKLLDDRMAEIPRLAPVEIQGSFYAFPGYKLRLKSRELSRKLLSAENVAVLPGSAFGPGGEKHLRLCFAGTEETIDKAMDGIKAFFAQNK